MKILNSRNFFLRAISDLFFAVFILRKQKIPNDSILIFYTPPPIIIFIFLFLNPNLINRKIIFVRDVFPLCMKTILKPLPYKVLDFMQKYILKKGDKILIESNFQKKYFVNYKNVFEFKNPLNKKRISSIKIKKSRVSSKLNGVYFGNYGYQHQNKNFEKFLNLSEKHNITCKYFGPNNINLNFKVQQKPIKFRESAEVLKNTSFQLVSVNDLVETNPLPYKMIELATLGIPPIFFASKKHYFHNEIKKFKMGLSVTNSEELMSLFTKENKIYNLNFYLLGENAKKYMFNNHVFNKNDRKLFE